MHIPTLKQVLAADAASCALFFAAGAGATGTLAPLLGLPPAVVAVAGWTCLPVAILLAVAAVRPTKGLVALLALGNAGWVLASVVIWVAFFGQLTPLGHAVIIAQAVAVELFVMLEWQGAKGLQSRPAAA